MGLFEILLKERDCEWQEDIAKCARFYGDKEAQSGSSFLLALAAINVEELDKRCKLYLEQCESKVQDFVSFFEMQKTNLSSSLKERFGMSIPGEEGYNLIKEKYEAIISSQRHSLTKPSIGFN